MRQVTFSIDIRALPGSDLDDCIASAIYERKYSQFDLRLNFNGVELYIHRDSTFESVMKSWTLAQEVRRGIHSTN